MTRGQVRKQQSGFGAFLWCLLDASDKRRERHEYCGSCRPWRCRAHIERAECAAVSRVAREDAEANVLTAVTTPKEPGAVERSRHDMTHMPYRSWCFSCVAGRGADDPRHKSDVCSGLPRVECDFMFLSSLVHLASPGLTIFNMTDRESQSTAAALSVKAASDLLARFFLASLDAWG